MITPSADRPPTLGRIRHLVTLDEPGPYVPDGDGGYIESSVPLNPPNWYCSIDPATRFGQEREIGGTVSATATHILKGHFHPGITTKTKVHFTDLQRGGIAREFDVVAVRSIDEKGAQLTLLCTERGDEAPLMTAGAAG